MKHIQNFLEISSRTLERKIALSNIPRQDSRSRVSTDAGKASRILDRGRKQQRQTQKWLEGYQSFLGLSSIQQNIDVPCPFFWCTRLVLQIADLQHNKYDFSILVAVCLQLENLSRFSQNVYLFFSDTPTKLHPQALHNCLDLGPIPRCISEYSELELFFIKGVKSFMMIRIASTSLGQGRIEGSVVHFTKDIHEVLTLTSNLTLTTLMTDTILITKHLHNVKTH